MASLDLRQGLLGKRLAAHLLGRATYNYNKARIDEFAGKTADDAVDELFTIPPYVHPEGPINYVDGVTAWLTTGPYENNPDGGDQERSVAMWFYNELMHDNSIRHKMTVFVHSIFITADDSDWRMFDYLRLLQYYALGSFKTLAYKMTLDNKMLRYLDNNVNQKNSPNENYAREFLELFTILKGEQIAEGNYTTYTEYDIQQTARVLTGFTTNSFDIKDPETGFATGRGSYSNHDPGNKVFSSAFQLQTIVGAVSEEDMFRELQDFIDMIFSKQATARSYCRRLYRFFVSDRLTEEVETDIIEPLSLQLLNDDFEVVNVVKSLLKSRHFYDDDDGDPADEIIGGKMKSPLEIWFSSLNMFDGNQIGVLNDDPIVYDVVPFRLISYILEPIGWPQYPDSVEGYVGFFKGPAYSKGWFDQSTIAQRFLVPEALLTGKGISITSDVPFQVDVVAFFEQHFSDQEYADHLITSFLEMTLPEMPDQARYEYFQQKLLGGLSSINWFFDWTHYLNTGDDASIRVALESLFTAVLSSPEFQTF